MRVSEIPGYIRAQSRADRLEDYWRDFAFLGLPEELVFTGGRRVTVNLLTLRMFIQLSAVQSPFIVGGHVRPEHVAQILWRLSPQYDKRDAKHKVRREFVKSIADIPFTTSVRTISRFLDRMFIDKPPTRGADAASGSNGSTPKSDTSFAASVIHRIASAYGWSDELILDLPMPRLLQYLRTIHREADPDMIHFNPLRDKITNRVTQKFFAKRQAERLRNPPNQLGLS